MEQQQSSARPTPQQAAWQDAEAGMFCHFGLNTFADREWGEGKDAPAIFSPSALDARQWAAVAVSGGFRYLILTAKHHDGFCLWPTETTDYSVKSSPWKGGKGDVVRECADACREAGLKFGVYLSPWDRHEKCYTDRAAYDDYYARQLTELLSGYGPLTEIWFDGAGSTGRVYDWPRFMGIVKKLQPDAMIFNMGTPTIRWVGNEDGFAPDPCPNTASAARLSMFTNDMAGWLPGTPGWVPAECDVSIRRPDWFWHASNGEKLLTAAQMRELYDRSVGHGANLLLNVAPDRRGLIPDADAARVAEYGRWVRESFASPAGEAAGEGYSLTADLGGRHRVRTAVLMEEITRGEHVREYALEARLGEKVTVIARGSMIGHKKVDRFSPVDAEKVTLRILRADETPVIRSLRVY